MNRLFGRDVWRFQQNLVHVSPNSESRILDYCANGVIRARFAFWRTSHETEQDITRLRAGFTLFIVCYAAVVRPTTGTRVNSGGYKQRVRHVRFLEANGFSPRVINNTITCYYSIILRILF